jgi:hypothetical protein
MMGLMAVLGMLLCVAYGNDQKVFLSVVWGLVSIINAVGVTAKIILLVISRG